MTFYKLKKYICWNKNEIFHYIKIPSFEKIRDSLMENPSKHIFFSRPSLLFFAEKNKFDL